MIFNFRKCCLENPNSYTIYMEDVLSKKTQDRGLGTDVDGASPHIPDFITDFIPQSITDFCGQTEKKRKRNAFYYVCK